MGTSLEGATLCFVLFIFSVLVFIYLLPSPDPISWLFKNGGIDNGRLKNHLFFSPYVRKYNSSSIVNNFWVWQSVQYFKNEKKKYLPNLGIVLGHQPNLRKFSFSNS